MRNSDLPLRWATDRERSFSEPLRAAERQARVEARVKEWLDGVGRDVPLAVAVTVPVAVPFNTARLIRKVFGVYQDAADEGNTASPSHLTASPSNVLQDTNNLLRQPGYLQDNSFVNESAQINYRLHSNVVLADSPIRHPRLEILEPADARTKTAVNLHTVRAAHQDLALAILESRPAQRQSRSPSSLRTRVE